MCETDNVFHLAQSETMPTAGRQQLKEQLIETVSQLCRNVLQFQSELTVEGLIRITVDHRERFLVNINETLTPAMDISGSVNAILPDVSNSEALNTDLEEYFAQTIDNVSIPLKRKRLSKRPTSSMHSTATQTCPPSHHFAKRNSHFSESCSSPISHMVNKNKSGNGLEADVGLQSLETSSVNEDITEYTEVLLSDDELPCTVKLESAESAVHGSEVGIDSVQSQCREDVGLNTNRHLSAECSQLAAAADVVDVDGDNDSEELSKTSEQQCISDPNNHASMDDGSQLIISSVFSVKKEPVSDGESQQPPSLQCDLTSNSELPGQSHVCQTLDASTEKNLVFPPTSTLEVPSKGYFPV